MTEQVWKSTETEIYTLAHKKGDRAYSRKVSYWTAIINGRVVRGFGTKKSALAAIKEPQPSR